MFEAMLQGEMNYYLGYKNNDCSSKTTSNRRKRYKTLNSSSGDIKIKSPRDRDSSFEPKFIAKRSKNVFGIEDKVLAMYARGMSQRDISSTFCRCICSMAKRM